MSFFVNNALAQSAAATSPTASQTGGFSQILILLIFLAIFYLLLWRPQAKRAKEHRQLMASLSIEDEIITNGGIVGKITALKDDFITLKIAENVEIKIQKTAIANLLPKGTV